MKAQTQAEWLGRMVAVGGPDECWNASESGYNKRGWHVAFKAGGKRHLAHRAAWEHANGPIPDGLFVLHKCDNPKCCNPKHLFLGTQSQNAADMWAKGRARRGSTKGKTLGPSRTRTLDRPGILRVFTLFAGGCTQRQIAAEVGITDVAISSLLKGKTYPEYTAERARIAHLLGRGTKKKIAAGRMTFSSVVVEQFDDVAA
jgi:hypothetical protein